MRTCLHYSKEAAVSFSALCEAGPCLDLEERPSTSPSREDSPGALFG
jgi:hypothetical protein